MLLLRAVLCTRRLNLGAASALIGVTCVEVGALPCDNGRKARFVSGEVDAVAAIVLRVNRHNGVSEHSLWGFADEGARTLWAKRFLVLEALPSVGIDVDLERTSVGRGVVRKSIVAGDETLWPVLEANLELVARFSSNFVGIGVEVDAVLLVFVERVAKLDLEDAAVAVVLELTERDSCLVDDACEHGCRGFQL